MLSLRWHLSPQNSFFVRDCNIYMKLNNIIPELRRPRQEVAWSEAVGLQRETNQRDPFPLSHYEVESLIVLIETRALLFLTYFLQNDEINSLDSYQSALREKRKQHDFIPPLIWY